MPRKTYNPYRVRTEEIISFRGVANAENKLTVERGFVADARNVVSYKLREMTPRPGMTRQGPPRLELWVPFDDGLATDESYRQRAIDAQSGPAIADGEGVFDGDDYVNYAGRMDFSNFHVRAKMRVDT